MHELVFNPLPSSVMHIDLNSCFATIEQQANPLLRGKPIAVAAYNSPRGCILAPSIEAKLMGVKTGMRVQEGKVLCPKLIVLSSDPWKYRNVHLKLRKLLSVYTPEVIPKSIDEFVLDFQEIMKGREPEFPNNRISGFPGLRFSEYSEFSGPPIKEVAKEIKRRIKSEIGDWLTVSVGIAPNRFLAKLASNLRKPDGLEEINYINYEKVFTGLKLTDLPYIKLKNATRLNAVGIETILDFYRAPMWKLKAAFESINGYYWYLRLKGYEIDSVPFGRHSYGNSYSLPKPCHKIEDLSPILAKLVTKTGSRLRKADLKAGGVHVGILYRDGRFWHKGMSFGVTFYDTRDIYQKAHWILSSSPLKSPVANLSVSVFNLSKSKISQLEMFADVVKKKKVTRAIDKANERFGAFVVSTARMGILDAGAVPDRIAFGGVKELEEFTLS